MAGKKKPSAAPQPQDDSVYRVKHISRSAWEEGALSLPGLTPKAAREEPEFDDVAMDMAMTGEIPLELIREMLRAQEEEQAQKKKRRKEPEAGAGGMIRPEEIVPAEAEAAEEAPTPEEIEAAKAELQAMKARSRLPQIEEEEPAEKEPEKPQKGKGRKKEKVKKVTGQIKITENLGQIEFNEEAPEAPEQPIEESRPAAAEEAPAPAEEMREEADGPPSLVRTFGLLSHMRREDAPGFLQDGVPLYQIPVGYVSRTLYRGLYYYGLRSVRPLRMAAFALPHLATPLLTLWHLARAVAITLHHITLGRARRAFKRCNELHAKRLAARKGRVKLRTALRGILLDYRLVLRPAANIAMPLAALMVLLIVLKGVTTATYALKIDYYGSGDLYIANESVFLQAQAMANRHIAPLPETALEDETAEPPAEADRDYPTFELARVRPEQLTNVYDLTDQLLNNAPQEMTSACGIYISEPDGSDRRLFATIKNSTDAEIVLTSIIDQKKEQLMKAGRLQEDGKAVVGFVQMVDKVQGFYPTDQLVDAQTLLEMLTQPQREEITVALQPGENTEDIQRRYGLSLSELYALNPGLRGNETRLPNGYELIVSAEVSTLEVKIVQTETHVEEVPYETVETQNSSLYKGEVRTRVKGENGQDRVIERVTYINGMRVGAPEEIGRTRIKEPVTERKELGSRSTTVQRGGQTIVINPSATGFTWPVPGCTRVSSSYGYRGRSFHKGIDIADGNTNGKIIVAAKDGVVELVQLGGTSYGNMILINHGNGVKTRYAHIMSGSISVRQGESVSIGQPIARVGSTGNSTGPHLHFEVIINGSTQNPLNYLKR